MVLSAFDVRLGSAFALALLGGLHCAGMCGGFVFALHGATSGKRGALRFGWAYHAGRVASYTTAGAVIGLVGASVYASHVLPVQIALLVAGAALLVIIAVSMWGRNPAWRWIERFGGGIWRLIQPLVRDQFPPRSLAGALVVGLAWGWIPCGMVYAALPLALVSGSATHGAAVMFAFGLGTLPSVTALQLAASRLNRAASAAPRFAWLKPAVAAALLLFAASDLAHAARIAGWQSASLAWLASICHS
jgi:uncharacterized protein